MKQLSSDVTETSTVSLLRSRRRLRVPHNPIGNESGVYAVLIAIVLMGLLLVIGLAVDSSKLHIDYLRMQRAADAGTIVGASKIGAISGAEIMLLAQQVARDNLDRNNVSYDPDPTQLNQHINVQMPTSNEVAVRTRADFGTFLMGQLSEGVNLFDISGYAKGIRRPVAVVLVADLSSSMLEWADSSCTAVNCPRKIDALKTAAKSFIGNFEPNVDAVGIVSFWKEIKREYPTQPPLNSKRLRR